MRAFTLALLPILCTAAAEPAGVLEASIGNQRNARGMIHACMTRNPRHFPDCSKDTAAIRQSVPAGTQILRFSGFPPGRYALTLIHDENTNQKLDMFLGIPKEGFGFSHNPTVRFGAPRFEQVVIELGPGFTRTSVRMQYIL